jgi:hypothetical protein
MARIFHIAAINLLALAVFAQQKDTSAAPATGKWKISGVVVDATSSTSLARAQVTITPVTRQNEFHTMVAGEDGRFLFDNLDPGKYTLTAEHKGYLREAFDQHGQYSTSIVVGPKLQSENLLFRLHRDASISGTVTDEQNEAVRNAEITLFQQGTSNGQLVLRARANTNDEGVYHFSHLSPGKYFVAASSQPWYAQHPLPTQRRPYARTGINSSQVETNGDGKPATSQEEDTSPGQQPSSPLDVAYPVTFYPAVTEFEAAAPIVLSAGEKFTADLNLRAVPALHLRIASSVPIQNGNVQVEARITGELNMPVHSQSMSFEGGVMEVSGLVPGHYFLRLNSYDGKNWSRSSKEVSISGDAKVSTDEKDGYVPVSGVVKLEGAGSLSGQTNVFLFDKASGARFWGQVSAKNEFEIDRGVPPGRYQVLVSTTGFFFKTLAATPGRVTGHIVEIGPGAAVRLTLELGQGMGRVDGVALKDDMPVAGVMVLLVPQDSAAPPQLFRLDQSDSDGTFTVASVVPGKYTAVALENGWNLQWSNRKVLKPYLAQGVPVQIEPNGKYDIKLKVQ